MPQEQVGSRASAGTLGSPFMEAGIDLAILAVVRRGDAGVAEIVYNITDFTAGVMNVDEARLARELPGLVDKGYLEFHVAVIVLHPSASSTCSGC